MGGRKQLSATISAGGCVGLSKQVFNINTGTFSNIRETCFDFFLVINEIKTPLKIFLKILKIIFLPITAYQPTVLS